MHGDFSSEQVSAFSAWATAQKKAYLDTLNKEFDARATMIITCTPPGNKWHMARLVENSRESVISACFLSKVMAKW